MNEIPYFTGEYSDVAVLHSGVRVTLDHDRPGRAQAGSLPGADPTLSKPNLALLPSLGGDIMPWGEGNDFPQRLVKLYRQDTLIPETLGKAASMLIGRGVMYVDVDLDDEGKEVLRPIRDPEVDEFLASLHFRQYLRTTATHFSWFFNAFPEMILSKDRKKIVRFNPLQTQEVRWCRMREDGTLPLVYLNANWPLGTSADQYSIPIHALDTSLWQRDEWLREQSFYNCIYPISFPTPGQRFYSLAHHYSIVESGWLDVHLAVPAFKKFLMKNQVSLKYHFKVDAAYWPLTFGDTYTKASPEEKRNIKKRWLDQMNKTLTDVEKAGGSIITEMTWNKEKNIYQDHIQITPIEDKIKDGKYIEDNLEAAANIFYALGVDPTLVGFSGGSNQAARSGGSDKREAYLIALQMLAPKRDLVIEPLEFAAEFNGWKKRHPRGRFQFRDTILTTLDTGAGTKKIVS